MKGYVILAAAVAAASIAACATVDPQPSASSSQDDKTYVTGSRIPVKSNSGSAEVQSVQSKQGIESMMRSSGSSAPPSPGK